LCAERKRYRAAENLYRSAFAIYEQCNDAQSIGSAAVLLSMLADLHAGGMKYKRAARLYKRAYERFESLSDIDHEKIADVCDKLAEMCRLQDRFLQAEKWAKRALSFHKDGKKTCCKLYMVHLKRLGLIYCHQGRFDRARRIFDKL